MVARLTLLVAMLILAAAAWDLALALGAFDVGSLPGADAPGAQAAFGVGVLSMLAGAVLAALRRTGRAAAALAPAAALFALAFEYTYDPYFAPTRRRYSEGAVPPSWMFVLAGLAVVVAVVTVRWPRRGGAATSLFLVLAIVSVLLASDGH